MVSMYWSDCKCWPTIAKGHLCGASLPAYMGTSEWKWALLTTGTAEKKNKKQDTYPAPQHFLGNFDEAFTFSHG